MTQPLYRPICPRAPAPAIPERRFTDQKDWGAISFLMRLIMVVGLWRHCLRICTHWRMLRDFRYPAVGSLPKSGPCWRKYVAVLVPVSVMLSQQPSFVLHHHPHGLGRVQNKESMYAEYT